MYPYSTLVNFIPTLRRILFKLVTCVDPTRPFAVVINLTGLQCEINEISHRVPVFGSVISWREVASSLPVPSQSRGRIRVADPRGGQGRLSADLRTQELANFPHAKMVFSATERTAVSACIRFNSDHEAGDQGWPCAGFKLSPPRDPRPH